MWGVREGGADSVCLGFAAVGRKVRSQEEQAWKRGRGAGGLISLSQKRSYYRMLGLDREALQQFSSLIFPSVGWISRWIETVCTSEHWYWAHGWMLIQRARARPCGISGCMQKATHPSPDRCCNEDAGFSAERFSDFRSCLGWARCTAGTAELSHPFFDNSCIGFHLPLSFSLGGCSICREIASTGDRWCCWLQGEHTGFSRLLSMLAAQVVNSLPALIKIRICQVLGQIFS